MALFNSSIACFNCSGDALICVSAVVPIIDKPSTIPKALLLVLSAKNFPLGKIISKHN